MKSALLVLLALTSAQANVNLPAVLSDRMVVQQGAPVRVWGHADPGETVTVAFHGRKASAKADAAGKWTLSLKPVKPGGPYEMTVSGQNTIVLKDVLVGELWIGSGQSNMVLSVARAKDPEQEIAAANYPRIRLFKVKLAVADTPAEDVEGSWQLCSPETVRDFSAVGYFFSREIQQKRHVPVGFIQSAWGGTPAEAWTSRRAMDSKPALKSVFDDWDKALAAYPDAKIKYDKQVEEWQAGGKKDPAPRPPLGPGHQYTPGGLYNAMIAPLTPLSMRGVLWYQGENNARKGRDYLYRTLFQTLIEDWRAAWNEGDFPFLFVQLPNYDKGEPGAWPVLRESQSKVLDLKATGMAIAIDVGEPDNIHPKNKQEVAHRLALLARGIAYKEKLVDSGPVFRAIKVEGTTARVSFDHVGAGLAARDGGALTGFTIAGSDGRFAPADAKVDGAAVIVSSPEVKEPATVRYAWAGDPVCNLINKDGLPAAPFRSVE